MSRVVNLQRKRISRKISDVIYLAEQIGMVVVEHPMRDFSDEDVSRLEVLNAKLAVALEALRKSRKRIAA